MALLFKWLLRAAVAAVALLVLGVALVYFLGSRSLPTYDATVPLEGLHSPVEIVRDNANVPHIFAETDNDVFSSPTAHDLSPTICVDVSDNAHN